jgi:ribosomal-protein-alanine N-acetyltransferase
MQYLTSDLPKTLDETRGWLRPKMQQQQRDGISLWSVVLRDGGKVIGDCGLQWSDETKSVPDLGFRLNRAYWGHGYAIEAARATLEAAFDQLGVSRVVAVTDVKNVRARRLIEQLGLRYVRETHWYGRRMTEYEIQLRRARRSS